MDVLHRLKSLGLRISIDDYGKGYSSLSYLQRLPIDELKIDKSLISQLTVDPRAAAIVDSTISLAHALDLEVVAEGIEDAETLELLIASGCDVGQGFHIARPMSGAALLETLIADREPADDRGGTPPAQRSPQARSGEEHRRPVDAGLRSFPNAGTLSHRTRATAARELVVVRNGQHVSARWLTPTYGGSASRRTAT